MHYYWKNMRIADGVFSMGLALSVSVRQGLENSLV